MVWYGMVWYAMLCYGMVWYGMKSMVCYEISMLCYAMVYVVKDKHSATVLSSFNLTETTFDFFPLSSM